MLGNYFYHEIIRKTVIAFGTLFNDIHVRHQDGAGNDLGDIKVPIAYGPRQKFLARITQQAELNKATQITLPRMSFEITNISYDSSRKAGITQTFKAVDKEDGDKMKKVFMPVPYNLGFDLNILVKLQDDGLQILEQILPFFQPTFNITLNMIPDMSEKRDVAITLDGINMEDEWDDSFLERRLVVYTLTFSAKSYLYGPYNKSDIIRKATVYETLGTKAVGRRAAKLEYTPKAKVDKNLNGQVDANDDILVTPDDDFGFNSGFTIL